jgi:hypothetical protein
MRLALRSSGALLALATSITLAGCVESFGGSNLQIDFSEPTPVPSGTFDPLNPIRPPGDSYFTFYALDHQYSETDPEVIELTRFYEIQRFEIQPVIRAASPCFIDLEESRYPGLHITQFAEKERERTGITNPLDPPDGVDEGDISDVLTADVRIDNLSDLEGEIKAVVSFSTLVIPDAAAGCVSDGIGDDDIPAPVCMTDEDNAQRLRVCRSHWAEDPNFYQGSDKVFTLPNNGILYGTVEGPNPINQGFVGGATISVDEVLSGFDAFTVNWNYKDEGMQTSATGTTFLTGEPESRTRGVINARLQSPFSNAVYAEVGIFSDLGDDNVNF